jgi:hypothetical protein
MPCLRCSKGLCRSRELWLPSTALSVVVRFRLPLISIRHTPKIQLSKEGTS